MWERILLTSPKNIVESGFNMAKLERAEQGTSILDEVSGTEAWRAWGRRYERRLVGRGEKPFRVADAQLSAIPPDTPDSLFHDLATGVDTVAFDKIVEELSPKQIEAVLESCHAFSSVAVMQFFKKP